MPYCPKCCTKLTKRKSTRSYHCKRHGFVRNLLSPENTGISDEEFMKLKAGGKFKKHDKPPEPKKPSKPKRKLNLSGDILCQYKTEET